MFDEIFSSVFFSYTSNFSNENDSLGVGVFNEHFQTVDKICPVERISSNADTQRLTEPDLRCLVDSFVGQCARSRNNAYASFFMDVSWHDANFALKQITIKVN